MKPSSVKLLAKDGSAVKVNLFEDDENDQLEKMKEILFILDKFKVSDQAYHELVTKTDDLPKLNSIAHLRDQTNSLFIIHRTPGGTPGAFISLKSELQDYIRQQTDEPDKIRIKISGDGTKVTRISNFIVLSYNIIKDSSTTADGQKILAIVKTTENYDNLSKCFIPVFSEINELCSDCSIDVDGKLYPIEIFFSGDMKFLQLCLGLGSSIGEYACPWCKVPKLDRSDTSKPWDYYTTEQQSRTIKEIRDLATSTKSQYGVKHRPLIDIEPHHIVPDELHLFMRIFDVLLRNVIDDAIDKDDHARSKKETSDYFHSLVKQIRLCGVTFDTWPSKLRNGSIEWTSLSGSDMKKVLKFLPHRLMFVIHNDTHDMTVKLWRNFSKIHTFFCSPESERKTPEFIFLQCKDWVELFLSIGEMRRKGYSSQNVTPYMHCFLYHVPFFISKYGCLRLFSGQPTEKLNDNIKSVHHLKTNHQDCAVDALKVQKRIETSTKLARTKRKYNKVNDEFWEHEIRELRTRKKDNILREISDANIKYNKDCSIDFETLSDKELKEKLKSYGINTKVRKREKLLEMVKENMKK